MIIYVRSVALIGAVLLLLAGCSGEKRKPANADHAQPTNSVAADAPKTDSVRKEFAIVREIVKQHGLQIGNDKRMHAVETALKERFPLLPDKGNSDDEKQIYRQAEELLESLETK